MIIIVEGIDRVGKTTLVNLIHDKYNMPVLKQERIGGNIANSNDTMHINYGRIIGLIDFWNWQYFTDNIIIDRFHWTDAVYSLIDRHNGTSVANNKFIEEFMNKCIDKYLIIYVKPTDIKWSSEQHGSDLSRHAAMFDYLYEQCVLHKCCCTHESYDKVLIEVERMLNNGKK